MIITGINRKREGITRNNRADPRMRKYRLDDHIDLVRSNSYVLVAGNDLETAAHLRKMVHDLRFSIEVHVHYDIVPSEDLRIISAEALDIDGRF